MATREDAGEVVVSTVANAEWFMHEFNQNSQIFGLLLVPWVNRIAQAIPDIYQQNGRIQYLNSYLGQLRAKVLYLENELDDALADRVSAEELIGDTSPPKQRTQPSGGRPVLVKPTD